ncbi:MAG TPA: CARDB domain-containing protein [Candidatus Krumholzibacteria bacterium]|nr:CARDB domain-containing protein [Candidatus Krumholzibacteria bacterium]HRX52020.1 CARDB domain-containing protein [Candidatus Krumholzibacteria bacterium]
MSRIVAWVNLIIGGSAAALVLLGVAICGTAGAQVYWEGLGGDQWNTNSSRYAVDPERPFDIQWSATSVDGLFDRPSGLVLIDAAPSESYVFGSTGWPQNRVYRFDRTDGTHPAWTAQNGLNDSGTGVRVTPSTDGSKIYHIDDGHILRAYATQTDPAGTPLWTADGNATTPGIRDYVKVGPDGRLYGQGGGTAALDPDTGSRVWWTVDNPTDAYYPGAFWFTGAALNYVISGRSGVVAAYNIFSPPPASPVWTYTDTESGWNAPTIDPLTGAIFIFRSTRVIRLSPQGQLVWESDPIGPGEFGRVLGALSRDGSTYYYQTGTTGNTGRLYAFDTADGSIRWTYETQAYTRDGVGSPVVTANNLIFVPNAARDPGDNRVFCIEDTGAGGPQLLGVFDLYDGDTTGGPSIAVGPEGYVYLDGRLSTGDGALLAFGTRELSIDLAVSHIERTPRDTYRYKVHYTDHDGTGVPFLEPGSENDKRWPDSGETVTLVGHIINNGHGEVGSFDCRWSVNGAPAGTVRVNSIPLGGEATVELDYVWPGGFDNDHTDVQVSLEVDVLDEIPETVEFNNTATDFLEGLALDISVDQATYDAFATMENLTGSYGFVDWLRAQIQEMNAVFARSVYDGAPSGCLERVRVDRLIVGAQPGSDATEDGRWHLSGGTSYAMQFADRIDEGLLHELMHQLGLIDLYNMNTSLEHNDVTTPDGFSVGTTFDWGRPGLMGGGSIEPHDDGEIHLSRWSVLALNSNCGYRRGYYGEFLYDIPASVQLRVLDSSGAPAVGAEVRVFQRQFDTIANVPVSQGTTDGSGLVTLPIRTVAENTTTATGHTLAANPFGTVNVIGVNSTVLIEVSAASGDYDHSWLLLPELNLAYWDGHTSSWIRTIQTSLASNGTPRVTDFAARVSQGTTADLIWSPVPGADSYTVYRASRYLDRPEDPAHDFENWVYRPIATTVATEHADYDLDESSRYAVAANGGGGSGSLSNRAFAPRILHPKAVTVHPDGIRTVLDPQNGYALLRQDGRDSFLENFGSVHFHLELSEFMDTAEGGDKLVFSHPGDYYTTQQSVRITDRDGNLLQEIGETGSAPGFFQDIRGVAVDGQDRIYVADSGNARVQVFAPDGSYLAEFGVPGGEAGQFGDLRGIAVREITGNPTTVYVCDKTNQRVALLGFDGTTLTWNGVLNGVGEPFDVELDELGNLYVSDTLADSVHVFDDALAYRYSLSDEMGLSDPAGLAMDGPDRIVVCDPGNKRVVSLRIDGTTGVDPSENTGGTLISFMPVHPNPTAASTSFRFEISRPGVAVLDVYDLAGRRVRRLMSDSNIKAGITTVLWDGSDGQGRDVASGVYFARLRVGAEQRTRKVTMVR